MEKLCEAELELMKRELIHRFEKDEQDERYSREENEAEHERLRQSSDRAHSRIDAVKKDVEALKTQDDAATLAKVKKVKGIIYKALGIVATMILTAIVTLLLRDWGLK